MATATRTMEVEFTAKDSGVGRVTQTVRRALGGVGVEAGKTGQQAASGLTRARDEMGRFAKATTTSGTQTADSLGKTRDAMGRFVKQAEGTGAKSSKSWDKAKSAVAGFAGGVAANITGSALGAVINFATGTVDAASDMNETLSKSREIFGDQAKSVERWASGGAKSFGLAKADALAYAASLGDMAAQIGFTGKQSASFGQDLVQVSADLGSFNNLETGDVLDRITAAMRGEYDSLQAIIPNINAARVEQEALTATGKKAAKELTAQDKALAVQAILHKDGSKAMGDFAKTSGGFANQQKIAGAQVADLQAKLGTLLLPILTAVMTFVTGTAIPAMTEFASWFGDNLVPQIAAFGTTLQGLMPALQGFGSFLADNAAVLLPLAGILLAVVAAVRIWTVVQAALNVVMSLNPIGLVVLAIAALVAGLIYAYQNSEQFRAVVDAVFKAVRIAVTTAIDAVVGALSAIGGWFTKTWKAAVDLGVRVIRAFQDTNKRVVDTVSDLVRGVIGFVLGLRDQFISTVSYLYTKVLITFERTRDGAVRAVTQLRDRVVGFVTSLRDRAIAFVISLRDRFILANQVMRDRVVAAVLQLRDRVVAFVTSLRDRAMAFVLNLRDRFIDGIRVLRDRAVEAAAGLRDRIVARVVSLRDTAVRVAGQVRDRVLAPFRALRDKAVELFSKLRDSIGKSFSGLLEKVKSPLRSVFSWMNRNLIGPLNSVTSKFGLTIPDLPRFHSGTSRVGGGGREVAAILRPDEAVLTGRAADRVGRGTIDRLNRGEGLGGPSWFDQFSEFISKPAQLVAKMAENGAKWAVEQVMRAIPNAPTSGVPIADLVPAVFNAMKARAVSWAAGKETELAADLGSGTGGSIGSGPWVKPVAASVGNGYLGYPGHYGVDFPVGTGTSVHAVSNAIVSKAATLTGSYGKHMFLRHADGLVTVYAHLSSILANVGQSVAAGRVIARSGNTGNSTGPHLHFETRVGGGYPGPNPRSVMAARGVRFDSGGLLPPGLSMVLNGTGGPEPVFTGQQWSTLRSGMAGGGGPTIIIEGALDPVSVARQIRGILNSDDSRHTGALTTRVVSRRGRS